MRLIVLYVQAVLENHHASMAFQLMYKPENNILGHMKLDDRRKIRGGIIKSILATDMTGRGRDDVIIFPQHQLTGLT